MQGTRLGHGMIFRAGRGVAVGVAVTTGVIVRVGVADASTP